MVVTGLLPPLALALPQVVQPLAAAKTVIGLPLLQQLPDHLLVSVETPGLEKRASVPAEPKPFHGLHDLLHGFRSGPLDIRILDSEHQFAAPSTGIEPIEQGGTGATDMQVPRGAGRKSGDDGHRGADGQAREDRRDSIVIAGIPTVGGVRSRWSYGLFAGAQGQPVRVHPQSTGRLLPLQTRARNDPLPMRQEMTHQ